jgi:hypothetical protein
MAALPPVLCAERKEKRALPYFAIDSLNQMRYARLATKVEVPLFDL